MKSPYPFHLKQNGLGFVHCWLNLLCSLTSNLLVGCNTTNSIYINNCNCKTALVIVTSYVTLKH